MKEERDANRVDFPAGLPIHWLIHSVSARQNDEATASSIWQRFLLPSIAIGALLCLLRVAFSLRTVRRYYQQSRPPTDNTAYEILENVRQLAAFSQPIELRESSHLFSAATLGWLRPVIILPSGWTDWSDDELLAVLAHEVAHIRRRDYPIRLAAYLVAAVHFYHPLVHWLTRRLVEQQELAADTFAATLMGGRGCYLRALSQMALRQDDRPNVWSEPIALPVSSSFLIRRIDMLKAKEGLGKESVAKRIQWMSVAVLAAIAIGTTAIRGTAQKPQKPVRVAKKVDRKSDKRIQFQRKPFNASLIADKGSAIVVLRVAELMRRPGMRAQLDAFEKDMFALWKKTDMFALWKKTLGDEPALRLKSDQIELIAFTPHIVVDPRGEKISFGSKRFLIRTTEAFDWRRFVMAWFPDTKEKSHQEHKYLEVSQLSPGGITLYAYIPDDRTVVLLTDKKEIENLIARPFNSPPEWAWAKEWAALDRGLISVAFDNRDRLWLEERGKKGAWRGIGASLVDQPKFVGIGVDWDTKTNRIVLQGQAICEKNPQAEKVKATLEGLMTLAGAAIRSEKALAFANSLLKEATTKIGKTADGKAKVDLRTEAVLTAELLDDLLGESVTR